MALMPTLTAIKASSNALIEIKKLDEDIQELKRMAVVLSNNSPRVDFILGVVDVKNTPPPMDPNEIQSRLMELGMTHVADPNGEMHPLTPPPAIPPASYMRMEINDSEGLSLLHVILQWKQNQRQRLYDKVIAALSQ